MATVITLIIVKPFIDVERSVLSQHPQMLVMHRVLSIRNTFLPFLNQQLLIRDADSKAFNEIISLYYPRPDLSRNVTNNEIESFRYHSKRMLTALHPTKSPSCLIDHRLFHLNANQIDLYYIQHNQIDDWRSSKQPLILYFHGGGFVSGDLDTYAGFECHLSKDLNMLVLHVNFRRVPENSLKTIVEDAVNAYQFLLQEDPDIHRRLIGMGDSSGGMLWIYLLQWSISNNKPVPQGVVLHSPWPNLDFLNINFDTYTDNYLSGRLALNLRQLVIGKDNDWFRLSDEEKNKISPNNVSFQGFPPLYVTAGTNEIFIDAIRKMTTKIGSVSIDVILDEGQGLMHNYALFHLWSSESRCVQRRVRHWVQDQLLINTNSKRNRRTQSRSSCE